MSAPTRLPSSLRALRHPGYRRWAAAGTLSTTGMWMQGATQAWLALQLSGSGTVLGAGVALQALPSLLLGPWGGVLADRFPQRRVLLVTKSLFALLAAVQGVAAFSGALTVTWLLVLSFVSGLVAVVDGPASGALGTTLVPEEDLANAAALGSATNSVGRIIGMSAAGVVVALAGPGLAFLLNAVGFLPTLAVLASFRDRVVAVAVPASPWAAMREGVRFVTGVRALRWLIALSFVLGALGRSYQVTMALMVDEVFGGGAGAYAACSTAFAVGALGGAVIAAHLRRVTGRVVLLAGALGAAGQLVAGAAPTLDVFLVVIVGVAAAAVVLDTAVSTRVATTAPEAMRGRIIAVAGAAGAGAGAFGGPALGTLAESFGARSSLLVGGAVCLAACALARRGVTAPVPTDDTTADVPVAAAAEPVPVGAPDLVPVGAGIGRLQPA